MTRWFNSFNTVLAVVGGVIGILTLGWQVGVSVIVSILVCASAIQILINSRTRRVQKRIRFSKITRSDSYLRWQLRSFGNIYGRENLVTVFDRTFPAIALRASSGFAYPFDSLCMLRDERCSVMTMDSEQTKFIRILGETVQTPQMMGFALKEIVLDPNGFVTRIDARITTYEHNLATSHILEWEQYTLFSRWQAQGPDGVPPACLKELCYRDRYHGSRDGRQAILSPSASVFPLLGVQAIVAYRVTKQLNNDPGWRIVVAERSNNVATKPGFFQFQPSGGFDIFGQEGETDVVLLRMNFRPRLALLREYSEELFRTDEFRTANAGDPERIMSDPHVAWLRNAMQEKRAAIEFLGVAVDLNVLRHEISFLIVIDDETWADNNPLRACWENSLESVDRSRLTLAG